MKVIGPLSQTRVSQGDGEMGVIPLLIAITKWPGSYWSGKSCGMVNES